MLMTLMAAAAALKLPAISAASQNGAQSNRKCFAVGRAQGSLLMLMRAWAESSRAISTEARQLSALFTAQVYKR